MVMASCRNTCFYEILRTSDYTRNQLEIKMQMPYPPHIVFGNHVPAVKPAYLAGSYLQLQRYEVHLDFSNHVQMRVTRYLCNYSDPKFTLVKVIHPEFILTKIKKLKVIKN